MASLLDIAPVRETVAVGGVALEVKPISAADIAGLMLRFGNVFEVLAGDLAKAGEALKPAIGAVIAAGCGAAGDAAQEAVAAELGVGDQVSLVAAIRRLTMPKGVRPFVQDLVSLGLPLEGVLGWLDQAGQISAAALPAASSS